MNLEFITTPPYSGLYHFHSVTRAAVCKEWLFTDRVILQRIEKKLHYVFCNVCNYNIYVLFSAPLCLITVQRSDTVSHEKPKLSRSFILTSLHVMITAVYFTH